MSGYFAVLRQLRSIWRSVPTSVFRLWFSPLLDYGNGSGTVAGLPVNLLDHLQSVLSSSVSHWSSSLGSHQTPLPCSFHWLRVPERIKFKLMVMVYWAPHGAVSRYLSDQLICIVNMPSGSRLWSSTLNQFAVPSFPHVLSSLLANSHLLLMGPKPKPKQFPRWHYICVVTRRWHYFDENWKHISSHVQTLLCSLFVFVLTMMVLAVIST